MKFTGFKVVNCLRANYPDTGILYAEIDEDQDPLLLARAAAAEVHNDCVLPDDLELRWTRSESKLAVRLVGSELVGETPASGDFSGLGWQVEAAYVDEDKHGWTVLAEGDDVDGVDRICAGLNALLEGSRETVLAAAAAGLRSKAAVMRNPVSAQYHNPSEVLSAAAGELEQMYAGATLAPVRIVVDISGGAIHGVESDRPASILFISNDSDDVHGFDEGCLVPTSENMEDPHAWWLREAELDGHIVDHYHNQVKA
ncbi:MAG: hypothetical protein KKA05_11655 [Alphaproteobacteria bacterium]|nr:hypothetical protein [Alphaproteobacteria bacterium]